MELYIEPPQLYVKALYKASIELYAELCIELYVKPYIEVEL